MTVEAAPQTPLTPLDYFETLIEPFDPKLIKTKVQGKAKISFVNWYCYYARAHREMGPKGFTTEIRSLQVGGDYLYVVVRVTNLNTEIYHDGLGLAPVGKSKDKGFGGAGPEAFSQAVRRAFAGHGLGLEMYMNEDEFLYSLGDDNGAAGSTEEREPEGASGASVQGQSKATGPATSGQSSGNPPQKDAGKGPTDAQLVRLLQLSALLQANDMSDLLAEWREQAVNLTKATAGRIIREMKVALTDAGVELPVEEDGQEGK